ncbi:MAG: hypothetical protein AAF211_24220 [Myxococcota bacterium]
MRRFAVAVSGLLAFAVGVALVAAFRTDVGSADRTVVAAPPVAAPVPGLPSTPPDCVRAAELRAEVLALREETAALETAIDAERRATAEIEGEPLDWPDVDARFEEAGVENAILSTMEELDLGELAALDCSEYPCVAITTFSPTEGNPFETYEAFGDAIEARGYDLWGTVGAVESEDGTTVWRINAYLPEDRAVESSVLLERLQFRYRDLEDAVLPSLFGDGE